MEANMSPNLSSAHFLPNTLLYEQVIFNLFNLIGIGSSIHRESLQTRLVISSLIQYFIKNNKKKRKEKHFHFLLN